MSAPQQPPVDDGALARDDGAPDDSRSGTDIAAAIDVAEAGSSVQEVHDRGQSDRSGEAPVEQVRGDRAMTEGQVVHGDETSGAAAAPPGTPSSGAAQSVIGARPIDRT